MSPHRSRLETLILILSCGIYTPLTLYSRGRVLEAHGSAVLCFLAVAAREGRRELPWEWRQAIRDCLDSGILYGTSLVTSALAAHLVANVERGPLKETHARLNFWCSVACGLSAVLHLCDAPLHAEAEPLLRKATRSVMAASFTAWYAIAPDRHGQLAYLLTCVVLFDVVCVMLRTFLRRSFSVGELLLVAQLVALVTTDFLALTASTMFSATSRINVTPYYAISRRPVDIALQGGVLGVVWLSLPLYPLFAKHMSEENETGNVDPNAAATATATTLSLHRVIQWDTLPPRATLQFFLTTIFFLGGIVVPWVSFLLPDGENPIWFVYRVTFSKVSHLVLLAYWVICLLIGLPFIYLASHSKRLTLIVIRKLYHILALIMFAPAVAFEHDFLALSFGIATAFILWLEYVRVIRVPPLGGFIHSFVRNFTDCRDQGTFVLTHMYLLVGCAAPVWVSNGQVNAGLAPFAGVLILGAGDAACAIVGSTWGRTKWVKDGRKTVEGTVAGIFFTLVCAAICSTWLPNFGFPDGGDSSGLLQPWHRVVVATIATCLLEAHTSMIDNLVLPLFFSSFLRV